MPYSIQQLDLSAPVILNELSDPIDPRQDIPMMMGEINTLVTHIEGDRVYIIIDMKQYTMVLGDLVAGMDAAFSSNEHAETPPIFHNRVRTLFVGNGMVHILVNGMKQDQYGNRQALYFKTRDEALT